jgi:hypothetical protein
MSEFLQPQQTLEPEIEQGFTARALRFARESIPRPPLRARRTGAIILAAVPLGSVALETNIAGALPAAEGPMATSSQDTAPTPDPSSPDQDYQSSITLKECAKEAQTFPLRTKLRYVQNTHHRKMRLSVTLGKLPEDCNIQRKVTAGAFAYYFIRSGVHTGYLPAPITDNQKFKFTRSGNNVFTVSKIVNVTRRDSCLPGSAERKTGLGVIIYPLDNQGNEIRPQKGFDAKGIPRGKGC